MSKNELEKIWDLPIDLCYRDKVEELQRIFAQSSDKEEIESNDGKVLYPSYSKYNHYFSDGLYVREMFCGGGYFGFTVIHNLANPLFVMKGTMWCTSENGVQKLVAPTFVLSEPGTKRICYFPEDSVVVTVHPNPDGLTDLNEIEKKFFSVTWEEYGDDIEGNIWQMLEHEDYYKKIENGENK